MKKLVKILAALTVAVAALAFVSCADGFAGPDGTVVTIGGGSGSGSGGSSGGESGGGSSGGTSTTTPAPIGTYNLTSMTGTAEDAETLTPESEGWDEYVVDVLGDDYLTLTVTADGATVFGDDYTWDELDAMEELGGITYTVSGNTITIEDESNGTLVYTKA